MDNETEQFVKTRVVTKNALVDIVQGIRNTIGWRQRAYEEMIEDASTELLDEVEAEYRIDWYRVDVDQMGGGAMSVSVYGQGRRR